MFQLEVYESPLDAYGEMNNWIGKWSGENLWWLVLLMIWLTAVFEVLENRCYLALTD
jgi:hypothetical protein